MAPVLLAAPALVLDPLDGRLRTLPLPPPASAEQAAALLDGLGLREAHWLGAGDGAAAGVRAAAGRLQGRLRRLVLCEPQGIDWAAWDCLSLPVLVLAETDPDPLLAERLRTRGPRALVLAPAAAQRRGVIARFLLAA